MTSCYDSENVDIVAPDTPVPAKYYIAGNILDAKTGEALEGATVTMNGTPVEYTGSAFNLEVEGGASYEFVVDLDGYYTATRTIFMPEIAEGGVSVGNAEFALVGVLSENILDPEDNKLADKADAQKALNAHRDAILATLNGVAGINAADAELIVDEYGNIRMVVPGDATAEVGEDCPVTLPYYEGFASTVSQSDDNIFTRAITEGSIWNASAEAVLHRNYGLTVVNRTEILQGVPGAAINGFTFVVYFTNRTLTFGGYDGVVTYQGEWYVVPTYDGHDNHDLHNILHGNHNGAGGGNSNLGY